MRNSRLLEGNLIDLEPCWLCFKHPMAYITSVPKAQPTTMHRKSCHCVLTVFLAQTKTLLYQDSPITQVAGVAQARLLTTTTPMAPVFSTIPKLIICISECWCVVWVFPLIYTHEQCVLYDVLKIDRPETGIIHYMWRMLYSWPSAPSIVLPLACDDSCNPSSLSLSVLSASLFVAEEHHAFYDYCLWN